MKKIKSLFVRDYEGNRQVIDSIVPGSEWVTDGEGIATRKYDGTACLVKDGILYKRYDVKKGKAKPEKGIPCEPEPDQHTGHWPWWIPIGSGNEDKWFREGFNNEPNGTYELVGPKVNGNRDNFQNHTLVRHGADVIETPRDYLGIKEYLKNNYIEGIVWHHPDGRMVKIKRTDFGLSWK